MKKVVIGLVVVILSIALLVTLPFMFKSNQEDYIDFSKVSENVDDNGKDDDTLRIGLISVAGDNKSYILEKELANYIGEKLNKKVKLIQKKSYSDINLLLKNNQIDVAFLSTGAYSLYEDKESGEVSDKFEGKVNGENINLETVNTDYIMIPLYESISAGYGASNSEFIEMIPVFGLKKNGTTANKFFSNSYFTHSHEESINQVINGRVSAAIVDDWALQYMSSNFSGIENNIKIIKTFPEVATGPVVTHKNYEDKEKIKQILLSIDKDDSIKKYKELLKKIIERGENYVIEEELFLGYDDDEIKNILDSIKKLIIQRMERIKKDKHFFKSIYTKKWEGFVCVGENGELIKPDRVTRTFRKLINECGLKKIRLHDLRHSCATLLYEQDIQLKDIQMWLGHSDIQTTANIYSHFDYTRKEKTGKIIEKSLKKL